VQQDLMFASYYGLWAREYFPVPWLLEAFLAAFDRRGRNPFALPLADGTHYRTVAS